MDKTNLLIAINALNDELESEMFLVWAGRDDDPPGAFHTFKGVFTSINDALVVELDEGGGMVWGDGRNNWRNVTPFADPSVADWVHIYAVHENEWYGRPNCESMSELPASTRDKLRDG